MNGYPDGSFKPERFITRAESISIIERINNENLRTPMKLDLSIYPTKVLPDGYGYPDILYVFNSEAEREMYEKLDKIIRSSGAVTFYHGTSFTLYENEITMEQNLKDILDIRLDVSSRYDMGIAVSDRLLKIQINEKQGHYERIDDIIEDVLDTVFITDSTKVQDFIEDTLVKKRNGTYIPESRKTFEGREVMIYNPEGLDFINIVVSLNL
jgi:hypothetical protein